MVAIKFALVAALAAAPAVFAYESYMAKIPNGAALGKKLGHDASTTSTYTPFGDLYKAKGGNWAVICKEKWPGSSVSVGAALGDPCCKFTAGGAAEVTLSAPNPSAKECAAAAPSAAPSAAPAAAPSAAPASAAPGAAPAGPAKVIPAAIPSPAPGSGNSTKPAPTPASSNPHKLCH